MRSALIHDWLLSPIGGAENCLQAIHELYPSPIYTLLQRMEKWKGSYFVDKEIIPSFLQKLPFSTKNHRLYSPLFPWAIQGFDLKNYDLLLSSSHCVAKGVKVHQSQLHICYCHTPMRYAWDLMDDYLSPLGIEKKLAKLFFQFLRRWDLKTAPRVDHFIANSHYVAKRIHTFYGRKADVIYPPVDIDFFSLEEKKDDFYLACSRLVAYKRIDLIVEAFSHMPHRKLLVIGSGPEEKKIRKNGGKNIEFLPAQERSSLRSYLQKAKGFVFSAIEDFGILPVEAMACGTPVIGLKKGGLCETVKEGVSGLFFEEASISSICSAIDRFEKMEFHPRDVRSQAKAFAKKRFQVDFQSFVASRYAAFIKGGKPCTSSF